MIRIAMDTGGTFTDFTSAGSLEKGGFRQEFVKYPTNHDDPAKSMIEGLTLLAEAWGTDLRSLLAETEQITHGTTLALNALLEKNGAKTALFTTEGFRDALEIRRSQLKDQWDLSAKMPPVLVPRRLRLGIAQRMDYKGDVLKELDEESVVKACVQCREYGVRSIAVCYLFSFLNPEHERKTAEIIRRELPDVFVTLSSDVAPKIREYERTSTTVINAYLAPILRDYLRLLKDRLKDYGWEKPIHIMMNNGGLSDTEAMENFAVRTLLSGPAGGACGNTALGNLCGRADTILADMGGTSFDVHVTDHMGRELIPGAEIDEYPLSIPMLDIHSIGAGGGSIVSVDEGGRLLVGPASAGSVPGPVCYGLGGEEITITDALLLLGLMDEEHFLGGKMKLDKEAAKQRMTEKVASPLGIEDPQTAANMIYRVASEMMADAIRLVTVAKGRDVRDYSLISAGGAFSLFAANIMKTLRMKEVLFPVISPVFCAWGMMGAARRYDFSKSFFMEQGSFDKTAVSARIGEMKEQGKAELNRLGVADEEQVFSVTAEMRYIGQHHEISVPWDDAYLDDPARLSAAFHQKHLSIYEYNESDREWEIIHFHLACGEKEPQVPLFSFREGSGEAGRALVSGAPFGEKGETEVAVYHENDLGRELAGPALIHFDFTSVLIPSGFTAKVETDGICVLREKGDADHDGIQ